MQPCVIPEECRSGQANSVVAGIPHFYLPVRGSPAGGDQTSKLANLLAEDPHSWKPVAIIHSLGLSTAFSWQSATNSMDEWLTIADGSGRNTPYLWIGPNAAGHLKPPDKILQEGNNALWHYNILLGKEAAKRGVENLSFYNMTLQAESWDGSNYGEKVSIVQAMMVSASSAVVTPPRRLTCRRRLSTGSPNSRRRESERMSGGLEADTSMSRNLQQHKGAVRHGAYPRH